MSSYQQRVFDNIVIWSWCASNSRTIFWTGNCRWKWGKVFKDSL